MNSINTITLQKDINLPAGDVTLIAEIETEAKERNVDPIILWNLWDGDETVEELLLALD